MAFPPPGNQPIPVPPRGERFPAPRAGGPAAPKAPGAQSGNLNVFGLLQALRRRWLAGCGAGLVCAALASVATWFLLPPPKHSARTLIRVPPGTPFLIKTAEPVPDLPTH